MSNQPVAIVPQPVQLEERTGQFVLQPGTVIVAPDGAQAVARLLAELLQPATGYPLPVRPDASPEANAIRLRLGPAHAGEDYMLDVEPNQVTLSAPGAAGLFYACQTLRQLLPAEALLPTRVDGVAWAIPCVHVEDAPRFGWRGAMLDVSRHFMPKEFVLKFIDLLALHKLNVFHWHLTDDQGWRVEIKKHPRLTTVGSIRAGTLVGHGHARPRRYDDAPHGGFYTQQEIREVVAYAQARQVTIVPEIDMPGHMQAAIAAYPELGNLPMLLQPRCHWGISQHILNPQPSTVRFMQDVLAEVMELFPGAFIHVGGDEALKHEWSESRAAQDRMRELGLSGEAEMQSWFIQQMDAFVAEHGRRLIGWDEILEGGLAPGASVMSWRGVQGGIDAARAGHDVVMAPTAWTYFDYYQSEDTENEPLTIGNCVTLEKAYSFEPIPAELTPAEAGHVLGGQGQLWTEYMPTPRDVEYMAFPRLCALAEAVWTPAARRSYPDFLGRMRGHVARLAALDVNYRPL